MSSSSEQLDQGPADLSPFPMDGGSYSTVINAGHRVIKVDRTPYSEFDARGVAQDLGRYVEALAREPIDVVSVSEIGLMSGADGYYVSHQADTIRGVSLARLNPEMPAFRSAVSRIVTGIAGMSTLDGRDMLTVGLDPVTRNWRVVVDPEQPDRARPVLIDVFPPLLRDASGSIRLGSRPPSAYYDRIFGTKSGTIALLLLTAYHFNDSYQGAPINLAAYAGEWRELVPAELYDGVVEAIWYAMTTYGYAHVGLEALRASGAADRR